jgi:hypothetical protein
MKTLWRLSFGLADRGIGVRFPAGARNFILSTAPRPALGPTQPPMRWEVGPLTPSVKWPGVETDCPPLSRVEVKIPAKYNSVPQTPS